MFCTSPTNQPHIHTHSVLRLADMTHNQVLFPMIPQVCDIEEMKKGGEHWKWNPTIPFYLGVLPRHGARGSDVKVRESISLRPFYHVRLC